ncbi:uncharacterized protein JCM10292_001006 [Rhodotorula paludigena]|uniref:uncharacterized protein n=1 Tax=Rhodotorula paludigena TaxID=86838 RepID=UPI00317DD962
MSADETLSLPSLETLEITSRDNSTTFVGPLLAAAVTELVNLYITDPDELSPAASLDILRALKAPQNLLLLSFSFGEMLLFEFPPSSVSALSGLETIEFARGSWSSSLLHSLCWLPRLAELYVDAVSGMSTAELRALVLPGTDSTLPSSST